MSRGARCCPRCGAAGDVRETRAQDGYTRRRYWCTACPVRWNTHERVVEIADDPMESFDAGI